MQEQENNSENVVIYLGFDKKSEKKLELIIAIVSLFIAIASTVLSFWAYQITKKTLIVSMDPQISIYPIDASSTDVTFWQEGIIPSQNGSSTELVLQNNSFGDLSNVILSLDAITIVAPRYYPGIWACDYSSGLVPFGSTIVASTTTLAPNNRLAFRLNFADFPYNKDYYSALTQYAISIGDILRLRVKFEKSDGHTSYIRDFYYNDGFGYAGILFSYEDRPISWSHIGTISKQVEIISQQEILDLLQQANARVIQDDRCSDIEEVKKLYPIPSQIE